MALTYVPFDVYIAMQLIHGHTAYVKFFGLSIDENNIESPQVLVDSARRVATCVSQEEIEQRAKKAYDMVQLFKNNNGIRPRDFNPVDWVF